MTYHFYFFVGKFPTFFNFSDSMEKIYLVELNIFKENAIYGLQKILLDNFSRNKISSKKQMYFADFISGSRNFKQHLSSGVLIFIHSVDACILVMACVDCARARASKNPFQPP